MNIHLIAYYIGIFVIFASHIYLLFIGTKREAIRPKVMKQHSYINIVAGVLIAYYFMHKEHMIRF